MDNFLRFLSLAKKSGHLIEGYNNSLGIMNKKKIYLVIMSKELFVHLNFIRRQAERYQSIIMSRELKSRLIIFVILFLMIKEKFYTTE